MGIHQISAWLAARIRELRRIPRLVVQWLRSNIARCIASVWLTGMVVFSATTVRRVRAAEVSDEPAVRVVRNSDGPGETVAMLDVDEINAIRTQRLHALGLAAAGEDAAPDEQTIQAARAARAKTIELDGEQVGTAGNIAVVTRGGIAGWLKRNRGKKADPETLAWLRTEEAAEGRATYAGWADRDDASILEWAKSRRGSQGGAGSGGTTGDVTSELARQLSDSGAPLGAERGVAAGSTAQPAGGPSVPSSSSATSQAHSPETIERAVASRSAAARAPGSSDPSGSATTSQAHSPETTERAVASRSAAPSARDPDPSSSLTRSRTHSPQTVERAVASGAAAPPARDPGDPSSPPTTPQAHSPETIERAVALAPPARDPGDPFSSSTASQAISPETIERAVAPGAAAPPARDPGTMTVQGFALTTLGAAAARALAPRDANDAADPTEDQITAVRTQIRDLAPAGTIAASVRDHGIVVLLRCDQLFAAGSRELGPQSIATVRGLGRMLAGDRGRAYRVTVDTQRALELVSELVIGGLSPERVEIAPKELDGAIDVAEIEWIDLNGAP